MRTVLIIDVQFVFAQQLDVAAIDIDFFRDQGPEVVEMAASSGPVLPDDSPKCQYVLWFEVDSNIPNADSLVVVFQLFKAFVALPLPVASIIADCLIQR